MDKRALAHAYYKYTLLCFKERYHLPLSMDMDITVTLKEELPNLLELFMSRASLHYIDVTSQDAIIASLSMGTRKPTGKYASKNTSPL